MGREFALPGSRSCRSMLFATERLVIGALPPDTDRQANGRIGRVPDIRQLPDSMLDSALCRANTSRRAPLNKKAANPSQPLQYPSIRQAPRLLSRCVGAPFLHHEFTNPRRCAFSLGDCRCPAQRKSGSFLMKNALDATVGNQPEERNEDIEELRNPRQPERYADA